MTKIWGNIVFVLSLFVAQNAFCLETLNVYQTGQTACYDMNGNIIDCTGTGQDGDLRPGMPLPNPRFVDNGDGTVSDKAYHLRWLKDTNCIKTHYPEFDQDAGEFDTVGDGAVTREHAMDFYQGINENQYTACTSCDRSWELPDIYQLITLIDYGQFAPAIGSHNFINLIPGVYWSRTLLARGIMSNKSTTSWGIFFEDGYVNLLDNEEHALVWPVAEESDYVGLPNKYLRTSKRFIYQSNGTMKDNYTGLFWLRNPDCLQAGNWQQALDTAKSLQEGVCGLSDGSKPGDWRLPTVNELKTLVDYGEKEPAVVYEYPNSLRSQIKKGGYWTSTSYVKEPWKAWGFDLMYGKIGWEPKTTEFNFLVVKTPFLHTPQLSLTMGGHYKDKTATASWKPVENATSYILCAAPKPFEGPETVLCADVGNITEITAPLTDRNAVFYVVVQAYNAATGKKSEFSNVVETHQW